MRIVSVTFVSRVGVYSARMEVPVITPEAKSYATICYALFFYGYASCAVYYSILISQTARIRDYAESKTRSYFRQYAIYYSIYAVFAVLWALPLDALYFWLSHHYKLSHQSILDWLLDSFKGSAIGFPTGLLMTYSFFWMLKKFPRRWPYLIFAVGIIVTATRAIIWPIIIDPIFNKYEPLPANSLRRSISSLCARAGVRDLPVFVEDSSRQSDTMNAHISGLGLSTRIIICDNTLKNLDERQVLAVVAHELGHYVKGYQLIWFATILFVGLIQIPINTYFARPLARRLPASWKIRGLDDFAIKPVLTSIAVIGSMILLPLDSYISRYQEHEADRFALKMTNDPEAMASTLIKMQQSDLDDPDPPAIIQMLRSHPSMKQRIEFASGKNDTF